ncbi:MAG: hypothetical protein AMXMBFR84_16560 [Candidatus Hydrogenedentota bacterium]
MKNFTLSEAAHYIHQTMGTRIHRATLWRWAKQGVGGRRLAVNRVGGRLFVASHDLESFLHEISGQ